MNCFIFQNNNKNNTDNNKLKKKIIILNKIYLHDCFLFSVL